MTVVRKHLCAEDRKRESEDRNGEPGDRNASTGCSEYDILLYLMQCPEIVMKKVGCSEGSLKVVLGTEKDQKNDRDFVIEFTRRS